MVKVDATCSLVVIKSCIIIDYHSLPRVGDETAAATEVVGEDLTGATVT